MTSVYIRITIFDAALLNENFSIFVDLARTAGLEQTLRDPSPKTVFAPPNQALLVALGGQAGIDAIKTNVESLRGILLNHIVPGFFCNCGGDKVVTALSGKNITMDFNETNSNTLTVDGFATVPGLSGLVVSNGVVTVIQGFWAAETARRIAPDGGKSYSL